MSFIQYYWAVFRFAFTGAWAIANSAAFFVAILGGFIAWKYPPKGAIMQNLMWAAPLSLFGVVLIVSLAIVAPYNIHKKQEQKIDELQAQINKPIDKTQLLAEINELVGEINQFKADRDLTQFDFSGNESADLRMQKIRKYSAVTKNLFATRYKQRVSNIITILQRNKTISEEEFRDFAWMLKIPAPYDMDQINQKLLEYSHRLK